MENNCYTAGCYGDGLEQCRDIREDIHQGGAYNPASQFSPTQDPSQCEAACVMQTAHGSPQRQSVGYISHPNHQQNGFVSGDCRISCAEEAHDSPPRQTVAYTGLSNHHQNGWGSGNCMHLCSEEALCNPQRSTLGYTGHPSCQQSAWDTGACMSSHRDLLMSSAVGVGGGYSAFLPCHIKTEVKEEGVEDMSLWARTQQLSNDALKEVQTAYSNLFPLEVRHYFAAWLEEQPWKEIDENNQSHEQYAAQLLEQLIGLLEERAKDSTDFYARLNFQDIAKQFRDRFGECPMSLVHVVKSCLETEEALVRMAESPASPGALEFQGKVDKIVAQEIQQQIELLAQQTEQTDRDLQQMQMKQEKFVIDYRNQNQITNSILQLQQQQQQQKEPRLKEMEVKLKAEKEEMDRQLLTAAQQLLQQRIELANKHKDTLQGVGALQEKVVNKELISWKRKQQLAGNGAHFDTNMIERLQKWCESLADLIWKNRQQIIKVDLLRQQLPIDIPQGVTDIQPELNQEVTGLLSSLVTSTFIVEQQPPQVMKKDARFSASVRLLVGGKLNLHMTPPRVKATIISEAQARNMLNKEGRGQQGCGDILNNDGNMDFHSHTGKLSVTFRNMSLKNIKRADRKGSENHTVAEEKFCILFTSDFNVGGNELKFQVWTLSLPVIVTVHGNQECQATATYLWDNQFSEQGRVPFQVPDRVPWSEVATMLSTKFEQMTGRGLSEGNLKYLATKLMGSLPHDGPQDTVTWSQFNKENLPSRSFTFWEWFWSIGKLVKEHLKAQWCDGSIIGFMDKNETSDLLETKPNGAFMLRFSDGTIGGITIAWVGDNPEKPGEQKVWNLLPFTIRDFAIRNLADRIKDLTSLVNLYPDIPKDQAFGKYYSPANEPFTNVTPGGYVHTQIINIIPTGQCGVNTELPQTAQPFSPLSNCSQALSPRNDAMAMDTIMGGDGDNNVIPMAGSEFTHEDPDFNKLNEWLATQSGFNGFNP